VNISKIYFEAYRGSEPYVFISYAHKDAEIVYSIIKEFYEMGYNIWYDEGIDPGNEWPDEIARALKKSSLFIVFISRSSMKSKNVINECNLALDKDISFVAIYIEEAELTEGLELRTSSTQAIMQYKMDKDSFIRKITTVFNGRNLTVNKNKSKDELEWKKALSSNSISEFMAYLNGNTIKTHEVEAREKIEALKRDEEAWNVAKEQNTIESYKTYIKGTTLKNYLKEAQAKVSQLKANSKTKKNIGYAINMVITVILIAISSRNYFVNYQWSVLKTIFLSSVVIFLVISCKEPKKLKNHSKSKVIYCTFVQIILPLFYLISSYNHTNSFWLGKNIILKKNLIFMCIIFIVLKEIILRLDEKFIRNEGTILEFYSISNRIITSIPSIIAIIILYFVYNYYFQNSRNDLAGVIIWIKIVIIISIIFTGAISISVANRYNNKTVILLSILLTNCISIIGLINIKYSNSSFLHGWWLVYTIAILSYSILLFVYIYIVYKSYYNKGVKLIELGKHEEAIKKFDLSIELDPKEVENYIIKANTLYTLKKYEDAIKTCDMAIVLKPICLSCYEIKGKALQELGKYEAAIQNYDKAIEMCTPNSYDERYEIACCYKYKADALYSLKNYEEAVKNCDKAVELRQRFDEAYNMKGKILEELGKYEESVLNYDKAINVSYLHVYKIMERAGYYYNKAVVLRLLKKYEEAMENCEKAIELDPYNIEYNNFRRTLLSE